MPFEQYVEDLLQADYQKRVKASTQFPPIISNRQIHDSVKRYCLTLNAKRTSMLPCSCCCRTIVSNQELQLHKSNPILQPLYDNQTNTFQLDSCGRCGDLYSICKACVVALERKTVPKFSSLNHMNPGFCQEKPEVLASLTAIEECAIAMSRPFGLILKLRPRSKGPLVAYHALKGHMIVLPQNPGPLLQILPSPDLQFEEHIKIVWTRKIRPSLEDLKPWLEVRKSFVIHALLYLQEHNHLYRNIQINWDLLATWQESFIPTALVDNMTLLDDLEGEAQEREGYAVNLQDTQAEDEFGAAQMAVEDMVVAAPVGAPPTFSSGCVYADIDNNRKEVAPELLNLMATRMSGLPPQSIGRDPTLKDVPSIASAKRVISFPTGIPLSPLNDYENTAFFTSAFPCLFWKGHGGHLSNRPVPISLEEWARWLCLHHSRRFAQHKIFIYLVFDTLQTRKSALGNAILVQRRDWQDVQDQLRSLTSERLERAACELQATHRTQDPLVVKLLSFIRGIGAPVPNSFQQKIRMRREIRSLLVRYGMPAFWFTLNPSDLRSPLVLSLAGVALPLDTQEGSVMAKTFRNVTATMNPVAVAQFFNCVCTAFFTGLVGSPEVPGIFGEATNHYGVVETNGRGMLHLHGLIWLAGNVEFERIRDRIRDQPEMARRMTDYLQSVIKECVDLNRADLEEGLARLEPPNPFIFEDSGVFVAALEADSNAVAAGKQLHSPQHSATCFKYNRGGGPRRCRFRKPEAIRETSTIDVHGVIHLQRNNPWINSWNPVIASCLRSNHDISFIATKKRYLAIIHYVTNYATKEDVSSYQTICKATLLKQSAEASLLAADSAGDLEKARRLSHKFALRCFNRMAIDREISGVQVASTLLKLPDHYTRTNRFVVVNLNALRARVKKLVRKPSLACLLGNHVGPNIDEQCGDEYIDLERAASKLPSGQFENYQYRGDDLSSLCLFEYCMAVRVSNRTKDSPAKFTSFDSRHPCYGRKIQTLARTSQSLSTVSFVGELFSYENRELEAGQLDTEKDEVQLDLAEILLGLFVPWQELHEFWNDVDADCESLDLVQCWGKVRSIMADHLGDFADNILLLKKSKEDSKVHDLLLEDQGQAEVVEHVLEDHLEQEANGEIEVERILEAVLRLEARWRDDHQRSQNLGDLSEALASCIRDDLNLASHVLPLDATPDICAIPAVILGLWEDQLRASRVVTSRESASCLSSIERMNLNVEVNISTPIPHLISVQTDEDYGVNEMAWSTGDPSKAKLTSADILRTISAQLPLNQKQQDIVAYIIRKLLQRPSAELSSEGSETDPSQLLLYIGGEGGTGKSQVVKSIMLALDLIGIADDAILVAPTGAAADNINGSTIHTSLNMERNPSRDGRTSQKSTTSPRMQVLKRIWSVKRLLIIDEVSMVDLAWLSRINQRCAYLKGLPDSSTQLFGGLDIVILMGDFFQFSPVNRGARALWQAPQNPAEEEGKVVWESFKDVVMLTESMRQSSDLPFQAMLRRARGGRLNQDDLQLLNSKVISHLSFKSVAFSPVIVRRNALRVQINRLAVADFASSYKQKLYLFPAYHTRVKDLALDILYDIPECGSTVSGPGIFYYTYGMPVVLNRNVSTALGLVNGTRGYAKGIVLDPKAQMLHLDHRRILVTLPPLCVLLQKTSIKHSPFMDLAPDLIPVFAEESLITFKAQSTAFTRKKLSYTTLRRQVPLCAAFAMTDYKAQGSTMASAILDLKRIPPPPAVNEHQRYCSTYVMLSRLQSSDGVHLLRKIDFDALSSQPDPQLFIEQHRLQRLADLTTDRWKRVFKA